MGSQDLLRRIPQVERVLQEPSVREALEQEGLPRGAVTDAVRAVLDETRRALCAGEPAETGSAELASRALTAARRHVAPRLIPVVNATGVVLHTNLGRAPLAPEAVEAMVRTAGYCNLEYDLAAGRRGDRHDAVAGLLRELTGAEAALVVNNNAAAVLLALTALARGREVVVSRGQLVEIGGSFRVPEVMAQSGAVLREIGTTNKTHRRDYEAAIGPDTAMLLKVHTSNYRVLGFTAEVPLAELVELGAARGLPVMEDLGSGCFVDLSVHGLEREPTVAEAVATGADLVTFSGDKLLGGPQAGLLVGRRGAIDACAHHPLLRALRPDKVTLAALEATLALYRDPARCVARVPALARLTATPEELRGRAEALAAAAAAALGERARVDVRADVSEAGGGALPLERLPTWVVAVGRPDRGVSRVEESLRRGSVPVVARIRENALVFDPRTLDDRDIPVVAAALRTAFDSEEET
ncbi:MAG: L-seryl-tRNA(Sec) selenium transferase [Deltaproteobacteria bacterium]|nr:L-seryl-tRNA(Sec) selenium transferase [Deltaproteobacteria bacterium]